MQPREARALAAQGSAHAVILSQIPGTWTYRPQSARPQLPRALVGTLSLVAVYLVALLVALLAPRLEPLVPSQAVSAASESGDDPIGSKQGPLGSAFSAEALPMPPEPVEKDGGISPQVRTSISLPNGVDIIAEPSVLSPVGSEEVVEGTIPVAPDGEGSPGEGSLAPENPGGVLTLGMYTSASLQVSAGELTQIDGWLADHGLSARVAVAGTFMDFEFPNPDWNIPHDLEAAWKQGDVPFVNVAVGTTDIGPRTAADVAQGRTDYAIRTWARLFAAWTEGGTKWAYIAPLQEMNGGWVTYGLDPASYKEAYLRVQRIFTEEGVPEDSVVWVFAPNGWSEPGHEFEKYYPGDEHVDVVAFSSFNFGACSCYAKTWDTFDGAFRPYLQRMREMAPQKPIFVAQTGTVAQGGDKDAWLLETFTELDDFDGLEAVIYFNVAKPEAGGADCPLVDWRLFDPESGQGREGFLTAIKRMEKRGGGGPSDQSSKPGPDEDTDSGEHEGNSGKPKRPKDPSKEKEREESWNSLSTTHRKAVTGVDWSGDEL